MTLFYKALQSSLAAKDGKKKYHPRLVKMKKVVTTQKIGELIAEKSSLTPGDVHNVIRNLMTVMREQLMNSRSVKLDGLGTFTVIATSSGRGVDTAAEVNPSQINYLKIQFTASANRASGVGVTRAMFSEVDYERWGGSDADVVADGENGDDGNDEYIEPEAGWPG